MSLNTITQDEPFEMVLEDRQPDAEWKKIQQNTFTRWVNQKLEPINVEVTDLETDFEEGLKLIRLVEVLSGRSLGRYSKKVTFRHQKLENISLALKFLENEEHIKIVNIDSSAIADRNLKLILGLVWTLILHYSISKQVWDDHTGSTTKGEDVSPKTKLMTWLKGKLPTGLPFTNFTSDWNDGILLGALVDSCAPDLGVDWRNWLPSQALHSTRTAMNLAKDYLNIAPLIAPEELISPAVDERSVMTYLSQFPGAKYTPRMGRFHNIDVMPIVGVNTKFTFLTSNAFMLPEVNIKGPAESLVPYNMSRLSETVYNFIYQPEIAGEYQIMAVVRDEVSGNFAQLASPKITAVEGAHLLYDRNVQHGMPVKFRVENAGNDPIEVLVAPPYDKGFMVPVIPDGNTFKGEFIPKREGVYELDVFQKGDRIAGSPFSLTVIPQAQINIWGRGLEPHGIQSGEEVIVYADYSGSLLGPPHMRVHQLSGKEISVSETIDENLHLKIFKYRPQDVGIYEVDILLDGKHIDESPYKIMISPVSDSKVRAFGPGLESGVANLPSIFLIETNGGRFEQIDIAVSGRTLTAENVSKKPDIELVDNKNGSAVARFTPAVPGIYTVKVCYAGEHVKGSPFIVQVQPANNNLKIADMRLSGIKSDVTALQGEDLIFWIEMPDTRVRLKPLVRALDEKYEEVPIQVVETKSGQYECRFVPLALGRYYFLLSVGGVAIPGSPFVVVVREIIDPSKIRIYGIGIGPNIHANRLVSFVIDPQKVGTVERFDSKLHHENGTPVNVALIDNGDETLIASYTPHEAGLHKLALYYDDMELLKMNINVKPIDISSIVIDGLNNETVVIGHREDIVIDIGDLMSMKNGVEVIVEEANGSKYMVPLENGYDSTIFKGSWIAKNVGKTKFSVFFDEYLVYESQIIVRRKQDATKCRVTGDGLRRGIVGIPANFQVDMKDAGGDRMKMAIKGPSESKTNIIDHSDGLCTVEYTAQTPGLYEISIFFGDNEEEIPGSPFMVLVDYEYDPSKILITGYNNGHVRAGVPTSFLIDATRTAIEPISVRFPIGFQQPFIEEIESRIYRVTFTPNARAGEILPLEVLYGGQLLYGRPWEFTVEQDEREFIALKNDSGILPHEVRASLRCELLVEGKKAEKISNIKAEIKGPDNKPRKSSLTETPNKGIYLLGFVPDMAGTYLITIYGDGKPLHSKPYEITAVPIGSANKCYLELKPLDKFWIIEEPKTFKVNANCAGEGALNIVSDRDDLKVNVVKQNDGCYLVTFTPHHGGPHQITLLYGGVEIPNGTFSFECGPAVASEPEVALLKREADPEQCFYNVEKHLIPHTFRFSVTPDSHSDKLSASVRMPSGKKDVAHIKDNADGTITVTYHPKQCGNHLLSVQHDGVNMSGSPISFYVSSANDGYVTVYGPGLTRAVVGEPAPFTVCAKGSPAKELAVAVEGAAKATIKCHDNKDGTCSVAWVPPVPGEYKVHVKLSGNPVKGSPFVVIVAGEGQKRAHLSVGSTSEVSLNVATTEVKGLSASIKSPSGIEEPCFIRQIDSANIGVSFTPREEGEHLVTVKKNGQIIPKSPFRVKVDKNQVGNASKVTVSGNGKANAISQQYNDVIVDTRNAGYGGLSVSVEGPSKAELKCTEAKEGLINVAYKPTEPGIYILSIKFADTHVKDSPFTVNCTGKGLGSVKKRATKKVNQAPMILPNQDASIYLKLENTSPMETTAKVMNPDGKSSDIEVRDTGDSLYQIIFKPEMDGSHAISVFNKGQHVLGSPFQFTVGHITEVGAHKVRAAGVGILRGETNMKQSFNVYSREAGQGELEVTVEGPSEAELQFQDHKDGNCHFNYKVSKPGEYLISIKFNNQHITDSPFKVFVAPATGEARRLELASFPDSGLPGKACTFTVLTHRAAGHLEAKVHTPSNKIETIDIVPIDEGESYALRFIPTETGSYYIDVTLDGAPMRDSPFRLRVGANEDSDPTAVTVSGDGIHGGETGHKCEFIINTCNAGSGVLLVQIDGPSKVTLDAYELEMGYKVRYMALAPGAYFVDIKYAGVHIPCSPFKVVMTGKELGGGGEPDTSLIKIDALAKTSKGTVAQVPVLKGDASKVTVKGGGLNKFFPGRPAVFNIDTALAGENLLFVGILTSKGPCEEVTVRHLGGGRYVVTYRIQERVKGFIFVKYGETNVPGSPFAVSF
ncbi:Filamin/ABP280 repeat family protein [Brugia malayi]|uniref:Bm6990 n=4 Tax=Brugia TaxID=6278 RepID=A0A1U7F3R9_BRUMA|nr:Filamin/ABP280 repeat family protein [Brugia malayi]CRZ22865.1 Bm6990 [Brugia malayi]VIO86121.1 Filamin/ABP280 repeat family protein [Brugia malayi]